MHNRQAMSVRYNETHYTVFEQYSAFRFLLPTDS